MPNGDLPIRCPNCRAADNFRDYNTRGYATCGACYTRFTRHEETRGVFLQAWDDARDSPRYRRRAWEWLQERFGF